MSTVTFALITTSGSVVLLQITKTRNGAKEPRASLHSFLSLQPPFPSPSRLRPFIHDCCQRRLPGITQLFVWQIIYIPFLWRHSSYSQSSKLPVLVSWSGWPECPWHTAPPLVHISDVLLCGRKHGVKLQAGVERWRNWRMKRTRHGTGTATPESKDIFMIPLRLLPLLDSDLASSYGGRSHHFAFEERSREDEMATVPFTLCVYLLLLHLADVLLQWQWMARQ